jgi:signal transduction histidine kinase
VPRAGIWVVGLSVLVIIIDILTPVQIATGALFILPLLFGIGFRSERTLYVLTAAVIAVSFALVPPASRGAFRILLANRVIAAIAMAGVAYLAGRQIRTNRELQDQRRRLADLMELQTEFVRAVSHDIRAPIGAVLGYVELLESAVASEPVSEQQARFLAGISRSCRNVVTLTENLLTTAKLDSGDFPVERAPFDLVSLVRDVIAEAASAERNSADRVRLTAPHLLIITSDAIRVRQVVLNLLSNALKYSPADRCVDVAVETGNDRVCVVVTDAGPGIPPEERELIFEPFYQSRGHRRRSGVGLGLPLARRLARVLGGDVTVRSGPEGGSRFALELPGE